jgi:hypothetical protein
MTDPTLVRFGANGSVSIAVTTATLPTDSTTALDVAFKNLGLISEDGVTLSKSITTSKLKAWGNGTVRTSVTDAEFTLAFSCLETSEEVLNLWLGVANSGVAPAAKWAIDGLPDTVEKAVVLEWTETLGAQSYTYRLVMPRASLDAFEDVTVNSNDPVQYGFTFGAQADANGKTAYLYTVDGDIGAS